MMRRSLYRLGFVRESIRHKLKNDKTDGVMFKSKPPSDLATIHQENYELLCKKEKAEREKQQRIASRPKWMTWLRRLGFMVAVPSVFLLFNIGVSMTVHKFHTPTIDRLWDRKNPEAILSEWEDVEEMLQPGDIVLLFGTGSMSWKITNSQLVRASVFSPSAMRYSHVACIVEPAEYDRITGEKLKGAMMIEAVDNKDVNCPDKDGIVRHDCVQVVEASRRIFGKQDGRRCYSRCAIRRVPKLEITEERKERTRKFIEDHVGQPMEKSPGQMLNFVHPKIYEWTGIKKAQHNTWMEKLYAAEAAKHPELSAEEIRQRVKNPGPVISCSELIADYLKEIGVIYDEVSTDPKKHHCPNNRSPVPSIKTAPYQFAQLNWVGDTFSGLPWLVDVDPEIRVYLPKK